MPGLLFPLLHADGSVAGWSYRPDDPRADRSGKPAKYEMPSRPVQRDRRSARRGRLAGRYRRRPVGHRGDEESRLRRGRGLCIVAINGVWGWLIKGGAALPDWRDIVLRARRVILAFDSDVIRNPTGGQGIT